MNVTIWVMYMFMVGAPEPYLVPDITFETYEACETFRLVALADAKVINSVDGTPLLDVRCLPL